jgi:hypothetical protein
LPNGTFEHTKLYTYYAIKLNIDYISSLEDKYRIVTCNNMIARRNDVQVYKSIII